MEKNDRDSPEANLYSRKNEMNEKLLVLPLGEESKKITKIITNDTARQIMELLADCSMSASDIANQLNVPLTTVKYNIENLVDVGLAKIDRIKYSEKGRQVKVYAPVRKLIVVIPEKTDNASIVDVLKKYLGIILAAIFASGFVELLTGSFLFKSKMSAGSLPPYMEEVPSGVISNVSENARDSVTGMTNDTLHESFSNITAPVPTTYIQEAIQTSVKTPDKVFELVDTVPVRETINMDVTSHLGFWFLSGCLFIIILVIIIDYYRQNKINSQ
jgi:predicted transcriptional regulator